MKSRTLSSIGRVRGKKSGGFWQREAEAKRLNSDRGWPLEDDFFGDEVDKHAGERVKGAEDEDPCKLGGGPHRYYVGRGKLDLTLF